MKNRYIRLILIILSVTISSCGSVDFATNNPVKKIMSLVRFSTLDINSTPAAPGNLAASALSYSEIQLTWEDASTNEAGFTIERRADGEAEFSEVAAGLAPETIDYTNAGLDADTTYYYRVTAFNYFGESDYSNEAFATTSETVPFTPGGLVATKMSSSRIDLAWEDNSSNETGFIIQRSLNNSVYTQIATVSANSTSYSNTDLDSNTTYYYRIRAYNLIGNSGYSNISSATTDDVAPAAPSGLTATTASSTRINLSWVDNSTNENSFIIQRSDNGTDFSQLTTVGANITSYSDSGLTASTTYHYRVFARNSFGDSAFSLTAEATTHETSVSGAIIIDHNCINFSDIPTEWINNAKSNLHIAYWHTSHGSQITTGMTGLYTWKGDQYAVNSTGSGGALELREPAWTDLGADANWPTATSNYLNANTQINIVIWSWCGQVSTATEAYINNYLASMNMLEQAYPGIKFVYMTGHLDGSGLAGNLHLRNEQIRAYCRANDKILFDFADIESYDPDGVYYGDKHPTDGCNYDYDGSGYTSQTGDPATPVSPDRNWAIDWQNSHILGTDWFSCSAAHSQTINANMKASAAWWLWARLAGWNGL